MYTRSLKGPGGGLAASPIVPQEPGGGAEEQHRGREQRWCSLLCEGEHGRGAVPAEGGLEDVQDLPTAV